ncbi:autotransporter outer membrane beta-barrel domain-containing protein [Serratia fonticola]|uniref:autotransporter family protein n=1 Tax=Serratia fonticola TaxID=47917 RepID=UPI00192B2F7A|nr:autotransporter outer membrane beta-barrel domain-containing protein [Serratia fonticola]MBL5862146.1 autotransporter outer membrane beta-barrel domain-containing protein [Serratia fonticola]
MMNQLSLLHRQTIRPCLAKAITLVLLGVSISSPTSAQSYDIEISSDQSTTISLVKPGNTVLIGSNVTLAPVTGNAITGAAGDVWSITNQGHIQATNGYAFLLNANGSSINNSGIISSSNGVWSTGALTFNNQQDALISVRGVGIGATVNAGAFILNNAGTITSSDSTAVIANTSNYGELGVSLVNSGLMQGKQGAVSISAGAAGAAAPVSITNLTGGRMLSDGYGVFILHGSSLVTNQAGAVISGSTTGVMGSDLYTGLNIKNAGTISSSAGVAVYSYGGGIIENAAGASIEGLGGIAYVRPVVYNNTNRVDNSGSIKGTGSVFVTDNTLATTGSGTGVYFGGGLSGTPNQLINRHGGTIEGTFYGVYSGYGPRFSDAVGLGVENSGTISGKTGIAINAGNATIVNSGIITGSEGIAIQFDQEGDYTNSLTLNTGSQLNGSVLGGSGHDLLVLNGSGTESLDKFVGFETLTMQGDNWRLTGSGNLANQTDINSGNLQLDGVLTTPVMNIHESGSLTGTGRLIGNVSNQGVLAPGSNTDFSTLTIQGNYVGNGGSLVLKTQLAADDSFSDKLVITGDASGDTRVQIINKGGSGALTAANGIQVVQIGGASDATFTLQGRVVAGAYEYKLFKNALDSEDGDWYLRSAKNPNLPPPPPVTPGGDEEDSNISLNTNKPNVSPAPLLRPEVGAYLGNQIAAQRLFIHSLHDRLGEPQFVGQEDQDHSSVWVRVLGGRMESQSAQGEIDERSDSTVMQIGGDIGVWENADSRLLVGIMAGYGSTHTRARAQDNAAKATGELNGYNLGLYGNWYQNAAKMTGPYIDTWLQYAWYDNTVKGNELSSEHYRSNTLSASIETGWTFVLAELPGSQVLFEPQAQVIYSHYTQEDHTEANGTRIHSQSTRQMQTRLGVRLYERNQTINGHAWQPYLGVNWWHGSGNDRIAFDDVVVRQDLPKNRFELKTGIEAELAKNWTIWGAVAVQRGQNHFSDINGTLGARYLW